MSIMSWKKTSNKKKLRMSKIGTSFGVNTRGRECPLQSRAKKAKKVQRNNKIRLHRPSSPMNKHFGEKRNPFGAPASKKPRKISNSKPAEILLLGFEGAKILRNITSVDLRSIRKFVLPTNAFITVMKSLLIITKSGTIDPLNMDWKEIKTYMNYSFIKELLEFIPSEELIDETTISKNLLYTLDREEYFAISKTIGELYLYCKELIKEIEKKDELLNSNKLKEQIEIEENYLSEEENEEFLAFYFDDEIRKSGNKYVKKKTVEVKKKLNILKKERRKLIIDFQFEMDMVRLFMKRSLSTVLEKLDKH